MNYTRRVWQRAPTFLQSSENEWPILCQSTIKDIPELKKLDFSGTSAAIVTETLAGRIDIERFSRYRLLINTTARILKLYEKAKAKRRNFLMEITASDVIKAEEFWVKDAQNLIKGDLRKDKYKKLCPRIKDNVIVVGGRTERWMEAIWKYFSQ